MTKRFVVGIDGSDNAQRALVWASRFAAIHEAELIPVMAWQYPLVALWPDAVGASELSPASLQVANEEAADAVLAQAKPLMAPAVMSDPIVQRADPAKFLCEVCEQMDADLLVIGSRGLGGFGGLMLGSVSAHCANAAPCPLAVIPETWDPAADTVGMAVVGIDESHNAEEALEWADEWLPSDMTLRLVHAWQLPITLDRFNNWIDPAACQQAADSMVEKAAQRVEHHPVQTEAVQTDARDQLGRLAADADLLVIGARSHRGIGRLMLGSVASSIVHNLVVPTLVVRDD